MSKKPEKFAAILWLKIKPAQRGRVKEFLCDVVDGLHGQGKSEIIRAARLQLGPSIDWAVVLPLLLKYLPVLLSLIAK